MPYCFNHDKLYIELPIMNNTPQQVTERYISNLLHHGQNREFNLEETSRHPHIVEGTVVGSYFQTRVSSNESQAAGFGATIHAAVKQALAKLGVTFR